MNEYQKSKRIQPTPDASTQPSRRTFLQQLGAFAGIAALSGGRDILRGAEANAARANGEKDNDEEYRTVLRSLERQIREYARQDISLSPREVQRILGQCSFIQYPLELHQLSVTQPFVPFTRQPDLFETNIRAASERGEIDLTHNRLQIASINYYQYGVQDAEVFYYLDYNAIFVDQDDERQQRELFERYICHTMILQAENEEWKAVLEQTNAEEDDNQQFLRQRQAELDTRYRPMLQTSNTLDDVPHEWLVSYIDTVQERMNVYRLHKIEKRISNELCLPHEAFHYFFDEYIFRPGYEGPGQMECLAMAIRKNCERFPQDNTGYALYGSIDQDIRAMMGKYHLADDEIDEFCRRVLTKHDLTERVRKDDPRGTSYYYEHEAIVTFVDEYLARIYNGALGNTDERHEEYLQRETSKMGMPCPAYRKNMQYYSPSEEEVAFLHSMTLNGVPLI